MLQREEALKRALDPLVRRGEIGGVRAVSDWVPSAAQQAADAQLTSRVEGAVMRQLNGQLGESLVRPAFAPAPLRMDAWLAHPVSAPVRDLWLGELAGQVSSVVMVRGLSGPAVLPQLAALASADEGVRWVDKTAEVSELLGRYRLSMTGLLVLAGAAVYAALWWRYRARAWRVALPTVLAAGLSVAMLGWLGQPFQLFNVLALLLLLGVGVDYGIFLMEHDADASSWMAVVLGAASTWLSFGLLGLSSTPALRAFGLTLLFGVAFVWLLAPLLREAPRAGFSEAPAGG